MELDFDRSGERIITQKLFGVSTHRLRLLFQSLLLRDVFGLFHERFAVQLLLKFQYVGLLHIVTDKNRETDILTNIDGKIVCRQHEKDDQSQQQQHQCRTDTRRNELHVENRT